MKISKKVNSEKMIYLDGLRGVFCIVVIIHHFMMAFFPNSWQVLYNDGNMAVMYFLLLSGFVMPLNIFRRNTKNDIKSFAKESCLYLKRRYVRLLPVVVSSIIISWFILIGGGILQLMRESYLIMQQSQSTIIFVMCHSEMLFMKL